MTALLVALIAGSAALGVLTMVSAWSTPPVRPVKRRTLQWAQVVRPLVAAVVGAAAALAVTGWVVAGLAAAFGAVVALRAWDGRKGRDAKGDQARIEALAAWCEQLRDLLSAEHGIIGTIDATVRTCPAAIRDEVAGLAARLSRQSAGEAVRRFADELDDPSGDLVASVILMATSRSSRTAEMLTELAATIRDRASMRLRIDAERSGARSEARFVVAFTAVTIGAIVVFGRDSEFLDAYDDGVGQAVLAVVVGLFLIGGRWLSRLTRFERPARFVTVTVTTDDADGGAS